MMSSAPSRRSRFTRSVSGTRISHKRQTKKCAIYPHKGLIGAPRFSKDTPRRKRAMQSMTDPKLIEALREKLHPLPGTAQDHDRLIDLVGDARYVLIGEASHGTHEFYRERARITKRLITEKGFNAVAIEGDWPSAFRVNRYVRAASEDKTAIAALGDFARFPTWMWRNSD